MKLHIFTLVGSRMIRVQFIDIPIPFSLINDNTCFIDSLLDKWKQIYPTDNVPKLIKGVNENIHEREDNTVPK